MNGISEVSIFMSLVAGILTFVSPCILPLFPSYISYISGKSFDDITALDVSSNIRKITAGHSLCFIAGFSVVFVVLGLVFSYLGSFFGIESKWLERIGGGVIILLGLNLLGVIKIDFLGREKKLTYHRKRPGYLSSLLMGMAFAVGWTPCVGPILSTILIYASRIESLSRAGILLFFYSMGLGVPFFIAGFAINQFIFIFNRFKAVMKVIPIITGVFLIFAGILLFIGKFSQLSGILAG